MILFVYLPREELQFSIPRRKNSNNFLLGVSSNKNNSLEKINNETMNNEIVNNSSMNNSSNIRINNSMINNQMTNNTKTYSNNMHDIFGTFGIEACRNIIIKEIQYIFKNYNFFIIRISYNFKWHL